MSSSNKHMGSKNEGILPPSASGSTKTIMEWVMPRQKENMDGNANLFWKHISDILRRSG